MKTNFKFTKKLENKYFVDHSSETKVLNCEDGYRLYTIGIKNCEEIDGVKLSELLVELYSEDISMYIYDYEFYSDDDKYFEFQICVDEEMLKEFNKLYKEFKISAKELLNDEIEKDEKEEKKEEEKVEEECSMECTMVLDHDKMLLFDNKCRNILGEKDKICFTKNNITLIIEKKEGNIPFVLYYKEENEQFFEDYNWFHGTVLKEVYNAIMEYPMDLNEELKKNKKENDKVIEEDLRTVVLDSLACYILALREEEKNYNNYRRAKEESERIVIKIKEIIERQKSSKLNDGYIRFFLYDSEYKIIDRGNFNSLNEAKNKLKTIKLEKGKYFLGFNNQLRAFEIP